MPHMQMQITEKQDGWEIETQNGTCYLPEQVVPVPSWLRYDTPVRLPARGDPIIYVALCEMLRQYVESDILEITAIRNRYFCRLSAPGYLDATDWNACNSVRECRQLLREA